VSGTKSHKLGKKSNRSSAIALPPACQQSMVNAIEGQCQPWRSPQADINSLWYGPVLKIQAFALATRIRVWGSLRIVRRSVPLLKLGLLRAPVEQAEE
jgi:hypothetical protein